MVKLGHPIENWSWRQCITQLFGVSAEFYKTNFGLPAHNGLDLIPPVLDNKLGYGTKILATHNGTIEKLNYDVPHRSSGNGIYLLDENGEFTTIYWHLSGFNVNLGQKVQKGEVIGTMGNTGWVRPLPTKENPWHGTHLHFSIDFHKTNDYDGFIDPTPLLFQEGDKLPIYWNRDLFVGRGGDDVSWLQTCLKMEGFGEDYEPISYFGAKTMRDVIKLQNKYQIMPSIGYFGNLTKRVVKKYSSFY